MGHNLLKQVAMTNNIINIVKRVRRYILQNKDLHELTKKRFLDRYEIQLRLEREVESILTSLGFKFLNEGRCAKAYLSKCGKAVVRVSFRPWDRHTHHAQNALENQDNSYFPKVYHHEQDPNTRLTVTVLEPLLEHDMEQVNKVHLIQHYLLRDLKFDAKTAYTMGEDFEHAIRTIKQGLYTANAKLDVNPEDIMQRNNGELVIIDPYF